MKREEQAKDQELELLKAVAQAWHSLTGNPKPTKEFDAQKSCFKCRPSRFKVEAMSMASKEGAAHWDFAQSLWDSYEIVTLSKKLEANLALDHPMSPPPDSGHRIGKRTRERRHSLRNLFNRSPSKRFDDVVPRDEEFYP